jgi:hypothetical protein
MNSKAVLAKMRKLCSSLPDAHEGSHSDAIAFKADGGMFATYRDKGDDCEVVFGLEPEHASSLIESNRGFERYPRAAHAVLVRGSDIEDWREMRQLVLESYRLTARKGGTRRKRKPSRARSR